MPSALLVPTSLRRRDKLLTVNAECYTAMLEIFLQNELKPLHLSVWFQEDGSNAYETEMEYIYMC
jgi:hypothetical protein